VNELAAEGVENSLVGQTIAGRYRILDLLGQGGMGCVYTAEQQMGTTVRKVAVKTLHKHLSLDPQVKARFQRECGTVAQLTHPNTIQVFDFGTTDDGTLYIVMELVQGRSLADIIEKEGAMPAERAEKILRQVCGSLGEAHSHGIVHRDLKPDNVVLCERAGQKDWVEVLDFGIAKRSSENDPNEAKLTQQGMVLGTPPYMSPEQFTGQPIDARSDIYALGVMAYEMLTGQLPFAANTAWEWASQHMTAQPTPFEARPQGGLLPAGTKHAIMKALAKSPADRFENVGEFMDAFSGAVAGGQNAAPPASQDVARVKTELAQPAVPGFVGQAPAAAPAYSPPAHVPAAPAVNAEPGGASPSGPNKGLLLGIAGGVAALSAIAIFVATRSSGPKPVDLPTTTAVTASTTSAAPSAAPTETTPAPVESVAPLGGGTAANPPPTQGGGTAKPPASAKPPVTASAKPPLPPACTAAQAAKARGMTGASYEALVAKCRAAGGQVP